MMPAASRDASALIAVAEGYHAHSLRTPYYMEQRSHADYRAILHLLRDAGTELHAVSNIVLPAAADDQDGARLTAAALKEWDQTPPSRRESLLDEVDARVFGIVVAHGTGDD